MALTAGTVTITANATTGAPSYAGSGLALAIAQAYVNAFVALTPVQGGFPSMPTNGQTTTPFSAARPATLDDLAVAVAARQRFYTAEALRATAYATAVVSEITTNGRARVTTEILGRTPNPNNPDTNIQAPAAPVDIPIN